jgi:hypothetical protein
VKPYNGYSHDQRMAAYRWLMKEYDAGTRLRPVCCDACTQTKGRIEPHSEDYSAPYGDHIGQYGLCYRCHMAIHCRKYGMVAWGQYRDLLRLGYCFTEPVNTFPAFTKWFKDAEMWVPTKVRGEQTRTVLDDIND